MPRTRLAALLTAALLLLPALPGQAATTSPLPPPPRIQVTDEALPLSAPDPGAPPEATPFRFAEPTRTAASASAKRQPTQLSTAAPAPAPGAQATAAAAAEAKAAPARSTAPTHLTAPARTAGQVEGYMVTLSSDTFLRNSTVTTTATVTYNGTPVFGARLRAGWNREWGTWTTDTAGQAEIGLGTRGGSEVIPISLFTPDDELISPQIATVYVHNPEDRVTIVSQVTDAAGNPIDSFEATFHHENHWWSARTDTGSLGAITPAGPLSVEVVAMEQSLLLVQQVSDTGAPRREIHPSGAGTATITTTATRDGNPISAEVSFHRTDLMHPSNSQWLGSVAQVSPGTYDAVLQYQRLDDTWIQPAGQISAPTPGSYAVNVQMVSSTFGTLNMAAQDGNGNAAWLERVSLSDGHVRSFIGQPWLPVRLVGGLSYQVADYGITMGDQSQGEWSYHFGNPFDDMARISLTAGQPKTVTLGGPATLQVQQHRTCNTAGCGMEFGFQVRPAQGGVMHAAFRNGQPIQGTFRLYKEDQLLDYYYVNFDARSLWAHLPQDPTGAYRATVDFDLGPYQGAIHGEYTFEIAPPPTYGVSLSATELAPDTTETITAQVTADGAPVPGARVYVGHGEQYGSYTTDGQGYVTFTLTTRPHRDAIPIWVDTEIGRLRLADLYVVPEGYSVVYLDAVYDRSGQPVRHFQANSLWYDTNGGGWDNHSDWTETGRLGLVRPLGTNFIEITSGDFFLFNEVTVPAGGLNQTYSAANTVPLHVTWTGGPGRVALHNQAKAGPSFAEWWLPPSLYVTPGEYSILFEGDVAPTKVLLQQIGVDVVDETTLYLTSALDSLAHLKTSATDGFGQPLTQGWVQVDMPNFGVRLHNEAFDRLVMTGRKYRVSVWEYYMRESDSVEWEYRFADERPEAEFWPEPGEQIILNLGGPAWAKLHRQQGPIEPGENVWYDVGLFAGGARLEPHRNWQVQEGQAVLYDPNENPVWTGTVRPWDRHLGVPLPDNAGGLYTLEITWQTGMYQGVVTAFDTIWVEPFVPVQIAASPQVLTPDQPTDVTLTVTTGGQPYSGVTVHVGPNGPYTPDANGQIVIPQVVLRHGEVWPVEARNAGNALAGRTNLFGLSQGHAAVEVSASDANGRPLRKIIASAEHHPTGEHRRDNRTEGGPVGFILPAGYAYVQVVREGYDAYLLSTEINLPAGVVTPVHLDGAQASIVHVTARIDGQPLAHGNVALRRNGNLGPSWPGGAFLNDQGQSPLHINPGTFEAVAHLDQGGSHIVARQGMLTLNGGNLVIDVDTSTLESISFNADSMAGPQCPDIPLKAGGVQVWNPWACVIHATPGAYGLDSMRFSMMRGDGVSWTRFQMYRPEALTIDLVQGQPQSYNWNMNFTEITVETKSPAYKPDSDVQFRLVMSTQSGWRFAQAWDEETGMEVALIDAAVRDSGGNVVWQTDRAHWDWNRFHVGGNPSPSYTIQMGRELNPLPYMMATAEVTLAVPPKVRMTLSQDVLKVGQPTSVTATLSSNGRPLAYAPVAIYGDKAEWYQTDARGRFSFLARPEKVGLWEFVYYDEFGNETVAYAYALDGKTGAVDVKAKDLNGAPLEWARTQAPDSKFGWGVPGQRKLILPVGATQVVVRGDSAEASYYMTVPVTVPGGAAITVTADGRQTVPLSVSMAGAESATSRAIYLRNTAVKYAEDGGMGRSLATGRPLQVTPGTYEAVVGIREGQTLRFVSVPQVSVAAGTGGSVNVDMAAATGEVLPQVRLADGMPVDSFWFFVGQGGLNLRLDRGSFERLLLSPGAWNSLGATLFLQGAGGENWQYEFKGMRTVTVAADSIVPMTVGGALTSVVKPEASAAAPGATVKVRTYAADAGGMTLASVRRDGWVVPASLEVKGPGQMTTFELWSDTFMWVAPPATGTYAMTFHRDAGPYGPVPDGYGSVRVIRLMRP